MDILRVSDPISGLNLGSAQTKQTRPAWSRRGSFGRGSPAVGRLSSRLPLQRPFLLYICVDELHLICAFRATLHL